MSTNGLIGFIHPDKSIDVITCDYDAYIEMTGKNLYNCYNHPEIIKKLFTAGSVKSVNEKIEMNTPHGNFYNHYQNLKQLMDSQRFDDFYEFIYLYDSQNQEWLVQQQRKNLISKVQTSPDDIAFNYNKNDDWYYYWHTKNEMKFEKLEDVLLQKQLIQKQEKIEMTL